MASPYIDGLYDALQMLPASGATLAALTLGTVLVVKGAKVQKVGNLATVSHSTTKTWAESVLAAVNSAGSMFKQRSDAIVAEFGNKVNTKVEVAPRGRPANAEQGIPSLMLLYFGPVTNTSKLTNASGGLKCAEWLKALFHFNKKQEYTIQHMRSLSFDDSITNLLAKNYKLDVTNLPAELVPKKGSIKLGVVTTVFLATGLTLNRSTSGGGEMQMPIPTGEPVVRAVTAGASAAVGSQEHEQREGGTILLGYRVTAFKVALPKADNTANTSAPALTPKDRTCVPNDRRKFGDIRTDMRMAKRMS